MRLPITYTKTETDTGFNIIPGEDIALRAKKMQAATQLQTQKDIERLKAKQSMSSMKL